MNAWTYVKTMVVLKCKYIEKYNILFGFIWFRKPLGAKSVCDANGNLLSSIEMKFENS